MPHDKIKDAARRRMAETGESYTTARREVIRLHSIKGSADSLPPNAVDPSAAFRVPVSEGEGPRCGVCAGVISRGHQTWCPVAPSATEATT